MNITSRVVKTALILFLLVSSLYSQSVTDSANLGKHRISVPEKDQQDTLKLYNILVARYKAIPLADSTLARRLKIADTLATLGIDNTGWKYQQKMLQGRIFETKHQYLPALAAYESANGIKADANVLASIERVIETSVPVYFDQAKYKIVYTLFRKWPSKKPQSFNLRLMAAESCYQLGLHSEVIKEYEWLLMNWQEKNRLKMSSDSVLQRTESALAGLGEFSKAAAINKRVYLQSKNQLMLLRMIVNNRLQLLMPVIQSVELYLERGRPGQDLKLVFSNPGNVAAGFLIGMYLADTIAVIKTTFYTGTNTLTIIPGGGKPGFYWNKAGNTGIYVRKSKGSGKLLVLEVSPELSKGEKFLFEDILKKPDQSENWEQFEQLEYTCGMRPLAGLLSSVYEAEINSVKIVPDGYWKILEATQNVLYLKIHGDQGAEVQSFGSPVAVTAYQHGDYERSSITKAFSVIELPNGTQKLTEISNPVFGPNGWKGAIRMGFLQNKSR